MWKLIFRNLLSRRRRLAWLLCEIVIVSIVIWVFVDPIVVNGYIDTLPLGYDRDRLCMIQTARNYDEERSDTASVSADMRNLLIRICNLPEVESATIVDWSYPDAIGSSSIGVHKDSVWLSVQLMPMLSGWNYFTTYGIHAVPGNNDAGELQDMTPKQGDIIVTRTLAELLFPGVNATGHYIGEDSEDFEVDDAYRIAGVIEDVRPQSVTAESLLAFKAYEFNPDLCYNIVVRLKDGVSMPRFIHDFKESISEGIQSGDYSCKDIVAYDKLSEEYAYGRGVTNELRLKIILSVFFFANLLLGVAGVFYLQTRKRSEEAGVMRSFGATPWHIRLMLLGEGWVLSTIGCLIGCLIYLQYAVKEGLARANGNVGYDAYDLSWVSNLPVHFILVSLVVYLLMVIIVSIGISIPAWRISRVSPVEALRHE